MRALRTWVASLGAAASLAGAIAVGCSFVSSVADSAAEKGIITKGAAKATRDASDATRKSMEDFTDSEEYYIGRGVSANLLTQYKPVKDDRLHAYVTRVGTAVALASDQPETFGGYRFQLLESDEVNAFAAPGGFIFITRGMLALCENEDMLACVLAHEVGHVIKKHGVNAIGKARKVEAIKLIVVAGAAAATGEDVAKLTTIFDGSLGDVMKGLKEGYPGSAEKEADTLACIYAARAGYDPNALAAVFEAMQRNETVKKGGVFATHPRAADRIETARDVIEDEELAPAAPAVTRVPRFQAATRG